MDLVFAADSIWNWDAEKNFKILKEENPDLIQAARRKGSVARASGGYEEDGKRASFVGSEKVGERRASLVPHSKT